MDMTLRILHLEDRADDARLVELTLSKHGLAADIVVAATGPEFLAALEPGRFDVILSDSSIPGFNALAAIEAAHHRIGEVPFIVVSGGDDVAALTSTYTAAGAAGYISKTDLSRLVPAIQDVLSADPLDAAREFSYEHAMEQLVAVIQSLSLARDLPTIMAIVRRAARRLTGADGATFVLRDGDMCHYADEDAISPLWKGSRFPMSACISGWAMLNRKHAVIEDIYADERIPADAYRPTFVKSLVMVPIRRSAPIGAIGNYWADPHLAGDREVKVLQALADSSSVAMESVELYRDLEQRVDRRTAELSAANQELESFSYSVSHDLRAPLRSIDGFTQMLQERAEVLDEEGRDDLRRIHDAVRQMNQLIDDLLGLSRVSRAPLTRHSTDLSKIAVEIAAKLQAGEPTRKARWLIDERVIANGDPGLLRIVLDNLLSNAWKYTSKTAYPRIEFGRAPRSRDTYRVRDNGAGFDSKYADKLFGAFQRLHSESEFPGTGVGLATVARITHRHGGKVWADSELGRGATFYFSLPSEPGAP
jgi:signal transduction histidine kinase